MYALGSSLLHLRSDAWLSPRIRRLRDVVTQSPAAACVYVLYFVVGPPKLLAVVGQSNCHLEEKEKELTRESESKKESEMKREREEMR